MYKNFERKQNENQMNAWDSDGMIRVNEVTSIVRVIGSSTTALDSIGGQSGND